jgi:hypothetical protein
MKEKWEVKRLHGQFPRSLGEGLMMRNSLTDGCSLETLREKQKAP